MAAMDHAALPPIHFFRPGRHVAMSGQAIEFSAEDLAAAAAAYDPATWPAPIVVGHPTLDAPAYGWVGSIEDRDGELYATASQVEPQFAELVKAGRYKKVSAAWFTPGHPNNPAPGRYYLKHLGFLGAAAPAVAGLKSVTFAAGPDDLVIEFGAADAWNMKRIFRALREWLIEKFDAETANRVVPDYAIEGVELAPPPEAAPGFAAPAAPASPPEGDPMSDADKARLAEIEAKFAEVQAENAALKAKLAEGERLQRHAAHAAFAEQQVKAGRLTPAMSPVIVAVLDALADAPPMFGAGEAAQPLPEALRAAIAAGPVVVDFAERGAPGEQAAGAAFSAPHGYSVDAGAMEIHAQALAWQQAHPDTDYLTAVKAVTQSA